MTIYRLNGIELELPGHVDGRRIAAKLADGSYEAAEARAAMARVRKGNRVLEIGAGLGYVTAICARSAGPENVVSVEANPAMLEVIEATLARNGLQGVTLLHGAVTGMDSADDMVSFHAGPAFWGGTVRRGRKRDAENVVRVPLRRIEALLNEHCPNVVIMDIEGAEAGLFEAPWPAHVWAVILELHPKKYPDAVIAGIVACMAQSGLTYDPGTSMGKVLGFRRLRG